MNRYNVTNATYFFAIGLSYKKADADIRGLFSLTKGAIADLLEEARNNGSDGVMAVSTCNRTEIYGFANDEELFIDLLCKYSKGTREQFDQYGYVLTNEESISHLFRVGSGLDSQILGDFEIISQIKIGFGLAKKLGTTNAFLERLINTVIQVSKKVKNETELSNGAASVSFAAVHYIKENVEDISNKKITLYGTGKIGRNTCENLVKHTANSHIYLINRTKTKAEELAYKYDVLVRDYENLTDEVHSSDVLIVATGAPDCTISLDHVPHDRNLLILDLSVPRNVDPKLDELPNVKVIHMDHLSQRVADNIDKRSESIPDAEAIIEELKGEFFEWLQMRKYVPAVNALKERLQDIHQTELRNQEKKINNFNSEHAEAHANRIIQKITTQFMNHLREEKGNTADDTLDMMQRVFKINK